MRRGLRRGSKNVPADAAVSAVGSGERTGAVVVGLIAAFAGTAIGVVAGSIVTKRYRRDERGGIDKREPSTGSSGRLGS
jgi:hypothetical protein